MTMATICIAGCLALVALGIARVRGVLRGMQQDRASRDERLREWCRNPEAR